MSRVRVVLITIVLTLIATQQITLSNEPDYRRLAGSDRYETAVLVSRAAYPNGADIVYIANGESMVDAMVAGAAQSGPVLLVQKDTVPPAVYAELDRLNPSQIIILGGEQAVSKTVEQALGLGTNDYYQYMLSKVNSERDTPLVMLPDISELAQSWTDSMATTGVMKHNPDYADGVCCWVAVAENVGWTTLQSESEMYEALDRLHQGFMDSLLHRVNILGDYTDIGIGLTVSDTCPEGVTSNQCLWITQNFRRHE